MGKGKLLSLSSDKIRGVYYEKSSHCRGNAVKHGLDAKSVIIRGESKEEYDKLRQSIVNKTNPTCDVENELVDCITFSFWRLRRARKAEQTILEAYKKNGETNWTSVLARGYMDRIAMYERNAHGILASAVYRLAEAKNVDVGELMLGNVTQVELPSGIGNIAQTESPSGIKRAQFRKIGKCEVVNISA